MTEEGSRKPTEEETREAMRRLMGTDTGLTDEQIDAELARGVERGHLELIIGEDGQKRYKMTQAGIEFAENTIKETLDKPAPWAAAETHLMEVLGETGDDPDHREYVHQIGVRVIKIEHLRLAELFDTFADDWAPHVAAAFRTGVL